MATNPNETGSYEVVHATRYSKGNQFEKRTRMVVIRFRDTKKPMRYAVRMQTGKGDNGPTFGGASYGSLETAHAALLFHYNRHNQIYKKGNPSHFPGIAK